MFANELREIIVRRLASATVFCYIKKLSNLISIKPTNSISDILTNFESITQKASSPALPHYDDGKVWLVNNP